MLTSPRDVRRVQNRGDDANPSRAGSDYRVEVFQVNAADGEPGDRHVCRRPTDIIERDGLRLWFGARGKHRADGDVIRRGAEGALGLVGRVGAEAEAQLRGTTGDLGGGAKTGGEEVFLSEMAARHAELEGELGMVIKDKPDTGAFGDGQNGFRHPANLGEGNTLGTELNEIRAARAKLSRDVGGRTITEVGGIDEGVKLAVGKWLHSSGITE